MKATKGKYHQIMHRITAEKTIISPIFHAAGVIMNQGLTKIALDVNQSSSKLRATIFD